jgi:DNA-binding NarL/FixJ family response regulator
MINIILIDDDAQYKAKLTSIMASQNDIFIQGTGIDYFDAITLVKKYKPDIAILNASLGFCSGCEILCTLKRYSPETAIVLLSSSIKGCFIHGMAKGDITGCILKDRDMNRMGIILRDIYKGECYVNSHITVWAFERMAGFFGKKNCFHEESATVKASDNENVPAAKSTIQPEDFSKAEMKELRYIADGYVSKEIAGFLDLKDGTVRNYISSIMKKTGLKTRTQVELYAAQNGFCKRKSA